MLLHGVSNSNQKVIWDPRISPYFTFQNLLGCHQSQYKNCPIFLEANQSAEKIFHGDFSTLPWR
jgi:hypothetical protein